MSRMSIRCLKITVAEVPCTYDHCVRTVAKRIHMDRGPGRGETGSVTNCAAKANAKQRMDDTERYATLFHKSKLLAKLLQMQLLGLIY